MYVPNNLKEIGDFATDLISRCSVSMRARMERNTAYRNIFLTGDPQGTPQTYMKTYAYIDDLASILYSPIELKLTIAPHGQSGPIQRALGHAAAYGLNSELRRGDIDTAIEDAVLWSLVKGKTFIQLLWTKNGLEPHLIMPEQFGVLEEGKPTLASQKAFFHRTWITLDDFADRVAKHPKRTQLMKAVRQYTLGQPDKEGSDSYASTRMVMLGGLYPYQVAGSPIPGQKTNRGLVDWLTQPRAQLAPETRARVISLDELWAWDSNTEDWVTIQLCGPDCVITPHIKKFNAFAEHDWKPAAANQNNPLAGKHPFVEFCVNRTPEYFWGDSEVRLIGLIQESLNKRIDGINKVLRKQENPPRIISGASINQNAAAKLSRPGGYLTDGSPQFKHEELMPTVPPDFWVSIDRWVGMFNDVGGMPSTVRGEGESGVRSQAHADTLVRMASPRFKDRALAVERSVDVVGGLALDIMKARVPEPQIGWVKEAQAGLFKGHTADALLWDAPAPGLVGIEFLYSQLEDNLRAGVDAHSSSPLFSQDARQLIFALAKLGAVSPRDVLELTHPPREEELVESLEEREAEKAAFMQAHPELLAKSAHGGRRR